MSTISDPAANTQPWSTFAKPEGARLGVSMSGGGIRSAAFSLGVYQRLTETGLFARARDLSAVSGGGYLAAALAISHALCPAELRRAGCGPWTRRSPEEGRLRANLSYLAPGGSGRGWLLANIAYGVTLNLIPLLLSAFALGRAYGLLLHAAVPGIASTRTTWVEVVVAGGLTGVFVVAAMVAVGVRRFRDKDRSRERIARDPKAERLTALLLEAALATLLAGVLVPVVVHGMATSASNRVLRDLGAAGLPWRMQRGVLGLAFVVSSLLLGLVAVALLQRHKLRRTRGLLAVASGVGLLLTPFMLASETAARRGWQAIDVPVGLVTAVVLAAFGVFAHNRRYSMHLFYRERVQSAFATSRVADPAAESGVRVVEVPYDQAVQLSDVAARNLTAVGEGDPFPELIMCAAVAVRGNEAPFKSLAASFTFEGVHSGNPRLGLDVCTKDLETGEWIGGGELTLPSIMAISGAAVSPIMGRFTVPAFRLLMALLNIRLGVWVRNPKCPPERGVDPTAPWPRRAWRYAQRGWLEPGGLWVLKEAVGLADTKKRCIYVSDGGHWENLGVVELLRRRCTHIVVVDASGDPSLVDIARAISIARSELAVEVHLDLSPLLQTEGAQATAPVAVGTFRYDDGDVGDIYVARCVMWPGAPIDLRLYADHDRPFPVHPTSNQFMPGERFDAYRALGWSVGDHLANLVRLPPSGRDERWGPAVDRR